MEKPKILKIKLGYNPNSSGYAVIGAVLTLTFITGLVNYVASLLFSNILYREVPEEKRKDRWRFVATSLVSFLVLTLVILHTCDILPYPRNIFDFVSILLLFVISMVVCIFTRFKFTGLISGLLVIACFTLIFYCPLVLYSRIGFVLTKWAHLILIAVYIAGLRIGYLLDRRKIS